MLSVLRPAAEAFPCVLRFTVHALGVVRGLSRGSFRVL
jgi:hypothetical protein